MLKKVFWYISVAAILLGSSCTVKIPVAARIQQQHSGAELISDPQYNVKNSSRRWVTLTTVSVGAGGVGYLFNYLQVKSDEKYANYTSQQTHERGLKWAAGYTAGTFLVGAILTKGNRKVSTKHVDERHFDQWLQDYSRKHKGDYVKYKSEPNGYLIIPQNRITDFKNEEARIKEAEERSRIAYQLEQKRLAQLKLEREAAEEKELFERVLKDRNRKDWISYLTKYPNGVYIQKVKEKAEESATHDVLNLYERGAWDMYIQYFPEGKSIENVRAFEKLSKRWDAIMDGPNQHYFLLADEIGYSIATQRLHEIKEYELELRRWVDALPASERITFLFGAFSTVDREKNVLNAVVERGNKRRGFACNLVQGDNLCLTLRSYSIDDKGEKIKNTEGETFIRLTIDDFNADKSRIKITVKEIYDVTYKRKIDSFSFTKPRRVWRMSNTDWIDPADWDLEYCK